MFSSRVSVLEAFDPLLMDSDIDDDDKGKLKKMIFQILIFKLKITDRHLVIEL